MALYQLRRDQRATIALLGADEINSVTAAAGEISVVSADPAVVKAEVGRNGNGQLAVVLTPIGGTAQVPTLIWVYDAKGDPLFSESVEVIDVPTTPKPAVGFDLTDVEVEFIV